MIIRLRGKDELGSRLRGKDELGSTFIKVLSQYASTLAAAGGALMLVGVSDGRR